MDKFKLVLQFSFPVRGWGRLRDEPNERLFRKLSRDWLFEIYIAEFRYIKIQLKTIDLNTRLRGINHTNATVIPLILVLKCVVLGWILICRNWSLKDDDRSREICVLFFQLQPRMQRLWIRLWIRDMPACGEYLEPGTSRSYNSFTKWYSHFNNRGNINNNNSSSKFMNEASNSCWVNRAASFLSPRIRFSTVRNTLINSRRWLTNVTVKWTIRLKPWANFRLLIPSFRWSTAWSGNVKNFFVFNQNFVLKFNRCSKVQSEDYLFSLAYNTLTICT